MVGSGAVAMIGSGLVNETKVSPNFDERAQGSAIDIILLHYTGMASAALSAARLCSADAKVSSHYLIDPEGRILQMVDERKRAWHAGQSFWQRVSDINSHSIGIEIQNTGHQAAYEDFPPVQMKAVIALCQDLVARYQIAGQRVLAHSDVAPLRKIDPGEKFDWALLHTHGIGHWVKPEAMAGGPFLQRGDHGPSVEALQGLLYLYGYGVPLDGAFEAETEAVVKAFQRHFRPTRVDGVADFSTVSTLHQLLHRR